MGWPSFEEKKYENWIYACVPNGKYERALTYVKDMEQELGYATVSAWNGVMRAYMMLGLWDEANKELRELVKNYTRNPSTAMSLSPQIFECVIVGVCRQRNLQIAEELLVLALRTIYYPTFQTCMAVVNCAFLQGKNHPAYWVWHEIRKQSKTNTYISEKCLQDFQKKLVGGPAEISLGEDEENQAPADRQTLSRSRASRRNKSPSATSKDRRRI